ncbi:MAG: isocitrate dehydrogenase [Candidatus Spechtbacteria bacterium RIFCSPLOWO2_01_FULL_38_20]|nr:MAG: isocitrate dehydrogenase [Candidatus Spechtbacteria bacterium RIFCSPHIGHO2_01_FULL_38_11]OGZ59598.1 MAG: isocitrate dehydrogenase [Candidatus Spechtbacteria bacterium RIFCSPLOWO2_01_FULL_38_20]
MRHKITLIPGDGIGPEIIKVVVSVLDIVGAQIEWDIYEDAQNVPDIVESVKKNKVALKGPISTPIGGGYRSINVQLRKELDMYANVRPAQSMKGVDTPFQNVDIVVIRENLEDLYAGIEFKEGEVETQDLIDYIAGIGKDKEPRIVSPRMGDDVGISIKPISIYESERIANFAFKYAIKNNRKKITAIHKANIIKYTDGLFLETVRQVAKKYPKIEFEDKIVDATAMALVRYPQEFDMLLCPNLYGDILSDLCAGPVGGLGVAPSANIGDECAIFEAVHGSAPSMAGQNKANPAAVLLSAVMMLEYLGEKEIAKKIDLAIKSVIKKEKNVTYDLCSGKKGGVGTQEMGQAIIKKL